MVFLEFAGFNIDQDHLAWGQTFFAQDLFRGNVQDTGFRGINNLVVAGDPVAGRAQTVAIEDGNDLSAVAGHNVGRAVPGLHHGCMVFEEAFHLLAQVSLGDPCFWDQHRQRVGQAPTCD